MDTQETKVLSSKAMRTKIHNSKILAKLRMHRIEKLECSDVFPRMVEYVKENSRRTRNECRMVYTIRVTIFYV